jgi:hypothetical protein
MRLILRLLSSGGGSAFNLGEMEFELVPEPDPKAREAVELALERLLAENETPAGYRSRWRAVGIAENLDDEAGADEG